MFQGPIIPHTKKYFFCKRSHHTAQVQKIIFIFLEKVFLNF